MNYNVSLLTSREECQAVITLATFEKKGLEIQKLTLDRKQEVDSSNSQDLAADLVSTETNVASMEAAIANTPEGPVKERLQRDLRKLQVKLDALEVREYNSGPAAVIMKQYALTCADAGIAEADALIVVVTDKLNSFPV